MLSSFPAPIHAVVIGASGGIGAALAGLLDADPAVGRVTRFTRDVLDLTSPASISAAAASLAEPPRLVICATGLLHADTLRPERALRELNADALARSFATNATGPALVAQAFLPLMPREGKSLFAALGARVGSISDNRLGGWHSYRAGKAALHQLIRTIAIEHARRWPEAVVAALHPGTVDTALSQPFQRSAKTLFTPAQSAAHLLAVVDQLTPSQSGHIFDWRGEEITP
ncbi:MAG: SDR family NAD(P)-dependent oxidoreductase [Polymorphobacter sp.]|uniref:SDR family NAD(P)-dependent oxidoreductase n=1 Tax=Polymorphobacter sp. TaxID=1909290 RepID=UPI003A8C041B